MQQTRPDTEDDRRGAGPGATTGVSWIAILADPDKDTQPGWRLAEVISYMRYPLS